MKNKLIYGVLFAVLTLPFSVRAFAEIYYKSPDCKSAKCLVPITADDPRARIETEGPTTTRTCTECAKDEFGNAPMQYCCTKLGNGFEICGWSGCTLPGTEAPDPDTLPLTINTDIEYISIKSLPTK